MKFYVFTSPKDSEGAAVTDFSPADGSQFGDAPRCPLCGKYVGMRPLLPPIVVELELWGNTFGDTSFGPGNELLVSSRFWALWQSSGLRGLDEIGLVTVEKVRSRFKVDEPVPVYRCCRIRQSRATINVVESGLEHDENFVCEECRLNGVIRRTRKIVLDANSWSGEDLFFARGLPGFALGSDRFEKFCRKNEVTNCKLIPADEFTFDFYKTK